MAGLDVDYLAYAPQVKDQNIIEEGGSTFTLVTDELAINYVCENIIGSLLPNDSPTFGSTRSATIKAIEGLSQNRTQLLVLTKQ
jgi:hypothetical protein